MIEGRGAGREMSDGTLDGETMDAVCRICGGGSLSDLDAREMMLGLREHFLYKECHSCGCVQIGRYPENMEKYYPKDYYSYKTAGGGATGHDQFSWQGIKRQAKAFLINISTAGRRRFLNLPSTRLWLESQPVLKMYLKYAPNPAARILDVGSGGGEILKNLHYLFYENACGIDPFVEKDIYFNGKLLIQKTHLRDLELHYDLISFNHVFEHLPDQASVLRDVRRLLAPDGLLMIRIPVTGGAAWRAYRENWVQLDAPRHYYLHSERSFRLLADQAGFDMVSLEYDSFGLQFWGSEMYLRDIPLMDPRSPVHSGTSLFSPAEMAGYEARAAGLNQARDGDQIVTLMRMRNVDTFSQSAPVVATSHG